MSGKKRSKFYAVRVGVNPGIYKTWEECRHQVEGYCSAVYKGFATLAEAHEYLQGFVELASPAERAVVPAPIFSADSSRKHVVIYADGACSGNPGPGGYGAVMIFGDRRKELSAGFRLTTNNRMEILGCVAALKVLKEPCDVTIFSDSKYVVNTMTKSWALKWRRNGWQRRDKDGQMKGALNQDLWVEMLEQCEKHRVRFEWVRGHDGVVENERCDELARAAAASPDLGVDSVYER